MAEISVSIRCIEIINKGPTSAHPTCLKIKKRSYFSMEEKRDIRRKRVNVTRFRIFWAN